MAAHAQNVEALLKELDDLIDPGGALRRVERVYARAVALMVIKRQAPDEMARLAALLRRAAEVADELGKVRA